MNYILLIYAAEAAEPQPGTKEFEQLMAGYRELTQELKEADVFVGSEYLQPVQTAKTVDAGSDEITVVDGPFAETKEQLGGYYIVNCETMDEALIYAGKVPSAKFGRVEVRPVF